MLLLRLMLIYVQLLNGGESCTWSFKPSKSNSICMSLKCDIEEYPPLFMNNVLIRKPRVLSVLGFQFNTGLTWTYMIDSSV